MSGIYIPGMEMPDRCFSCPMHDTNCCGISRGSYIEYREVDIDVAIDHRPDWCPLIPVPEHGGLIDARQCYEGIKKWIIKFYAAYERDKKDERIAALLELDLAVRAAIADAPTIIPASPADKEVEG